MRNFFFFNAVFHNTVTITIFTWAMTTFTGDRTIHIAASMFQDTVSLKVERHMKPTFTVIFLIIAISKQDYGLLAQIRGILRIQFCSTFPPFGDTIRMRKIDQDKLKGNI
jgi:hypothetical protein